MMKDKTLMCMDCGQEFTFTAGEQEFYAERGFDTEPQRCKACRDMRKRERNNARPMYDAVCSRCTDECKVPFEPDPSRPVYCLQCLTEMRG